MDWLVSEAPKYGIRLLLSLTNGAIGHGGMQQYVKWANLATVQVRRPLPLDEQMPTDPH